MNVQLKALFGKLNGHCYAALNQAAAACVARGGAEIGVEDVLLECSADSASDLPLLLQQQGVAVADWMRALRHEIERAEGGAGKPVFAAALMELFQQAWLVASIDHGAERIRSAHLLLAILAQPRLYRLKAWAGILDRLSPSEIAARLDAALAGSVETPQAGPDSAGTQATKDSALARFTTDFTARAHEGRLDPVFCRDAEIRQLIDIISRRQKNNPILVGDPGVGKSAVVEGLAQRILAGEVPEPIRNARVLGLDLGLLQAGASVKGEFEKRLQQVIQEVKEQPSPVVLFIDEAHTLVGAGAQGNDAANLLKPALARGELRAIAATTWSEYKKYFEKDPALARRFQLVKLDEPTVPEAVTILRGLRAVYEKAHGVYVRDDAIAEAAALSARYITGRQLPDKAVDVLDTACARINIGLSAKPLPLEALEQEAAVAARHREALARDVAMGVGKAAALTPLDAQIDALQQRAAELRARWEEERALARQLLDLRAQAASTPGQRSLEAEIEACKVRLDAFAEAGALVPYEVTPEVVGQVIADWTGVPLGKIVRDEAQVLLDFTVRFARFVKGQDHAGKAIGERIRAAKSGLGNPDAPIGVFLLVGPSGVGKTETAIAVAELLFGGRQALTTINMSEFQERHTISRLVGSPPGYVGYGEGGVLTEAVRQRPYSVVLLDEVEKADLEVLNLFYQVFDKGTLSDGEGREIDFRNTVIFLTSNLGTDEVMRAHLSGQATDPAAFEMLLHPVLTRHFKPALLGRMEVIPYLPIGPVVLREIVEAKLGRLRTRLHASRNIEFSHAPALVDYVVARCNVGDAGARNIDAVINKHILPEVAHDLVVSLTEQHPVRSIEVGVSDGLLKVSLHRETEEVPKSH